MDKDYLIAKLKEYNSKLKGNWYGEYVKLCDKDIGNKLHYAIVTNTPIDNRECIALVGLVGDTKEQQESSEQIIEFISFIKNNLKEIVELLEN